MGMLKLVLLLCTAHLCLVGKASAQVLKPLVPNAKLQKNEQTVNHSKPLVFTADSSSELRAIQELRKKGSITAAQERANKYLNAHPNDVDVRFLLGLMQLQQQNYLQAENNLTMVLNKYPHYSEARIGLIQLKINEKKYVEAKQLIQQGLILNSHNQNKELFSLRKKIDYLENGPQEHSGPIASTEKKSKLYSKSPLLRKYKVGATKSTAKSYELNLRQAKQYEKEGKYQQQYFLLSNTVKNNPHTTEYRLALANYYLAHNAQLSAMTVVSDGLRQEPNNIALLVKKAEIQMALYEYPQAALALRQALTNNPQDKNAKVYLDEIIEINPPFNYGVNEIGFFTDNAYVTDLHSIWDYSTFYYTRDIDSGRIGGRVNYASRRGLDAPQFEFDYAPRLSTNLYLDLAAAISNQPALFPDRMVRGEAYYKLAQAWEVSAGGQYSRVASTYFSTYTSSVNLYTGNYWLSFRPYYFVPKTHDTSLLYTGTIRRYFATLDHFIGVNFGSGTSPDIADLLTVNFIVIKNSFVNVNYEFPIFNHKLVLDVGAGYQRWKYPSTLIRNLYDAKLGIKYRF